MHSGTTDSAVRSRLFLSLFKSPKEGFNTTIPVAWAPTADRSSNMSKIMATRKKKKAEIHPHALFPTITPWIDENYGKVIGRK